MKSLWRILVPTLINGVPVRTRYHRVWDAKVRRITNGLTILSPTKGQWISPSGELLIERMIPVEIICTDKEMDEIVDMTIAYYDQEAVTYCKLSDKVEIRFR